MEQSINAQRGVCGNLQQVAPGNDHEKVVELLRKSTDIHLSLHSLRSVSAD
jgi:hypothetical protein